MTRSGFIRMSLWSFFGILAARLGFLHIFPGSQLDKLARRQYGAQLSGFPKRADILDRRGEPLAITIERPSLAVNPRVFKVSPEQKKQLAKALQISHEKLEKSLQSQQYFSWLKRRVSPQIFAEIKALNLEGIQILPEPSRYYPKGSLASQVLGFVGTENRGLSGVEKSWDSYLSTGFRDQQPTSKDGKGQLVYLDAQEASPQTRREGLVLTFDSALQGIAEEVLEKWLRESTAEFGFIIISDPHSGALLAWAEQPSHDPHTPPKHLEAMKIRGLSDLFEPGSTLKPLIVAGAIEDETTSPDQWYDCEEGRMAIGNVIIHDTKPRGWLTTTGILAHSSNIGMYKIAQQMGPDRLAYYLKQLRIGSPLASLPWSESAHGRIPSLPWSPIRFANLAFGQGLSVSGLELVQAFGSLANGGWLIPPFIVEGGERPRSKLFSTATTRALRHMLSQNTTPRGRSRQYTIAGKSGTAQNYDPRLKAYSPTRFTTSYIGFAPAYDPHILVYVVLQNPKTPAFGSRWAAPAFVEVMDRSLNYLNVPKDKTPPSSSS